MALGTLAFVCPCCCLKSIPSAPISFPVASCSGAVTSKPAGSYSTNGSPVFIEAASS